MPGTREEGWVMGEKKEEVTFRGPEGRVESRGS
jgi:hypothetical protein